MATTLLAPQIRQRLVKLLVPVCNNSESHAAQELKWLWQHANDEASKKSDSSTIRHNDVAMALLEDYVHERVQHRKPLQYILGTQPFLKLEILTRPPTLIPRWETEEWTNYLALRLCASHVRFKPQQLSKLLDTNTTSADRRDRFNIVDLCTGSGCIALGLASMLPANTTNVLGIDIDKRAVQLARDNLAFNRSLLDKNEALQSNEVRFEQLDLTRESAPDSLYKWSGDKNGSEPSFVGYDLVVSNPPYIDPEELSTLEPEVRQWEDPKALIADQRGLYFYPRIAKIAVMVLKSNRTLRNGPILDQIDVPELMLEIGGDHQAEDVTRFVREAGFTRTEVWKDLAERARCIIASR
ncbi:hypothetical protein BGW41_001028 [Actinomortierella wolfii]|nr:hypothetical protein BGW41_001028 [Actinomortierella wolfii]